MPGNWRPEAAQGQAGQGGGFGPPEHPGGHATHELLGAAWGAHLTPVMCTPASKTPAREAAGNQWPLSARLDA